MLSASGSMLESLPRQELRSSVSGSRFMEEFSHVKLIGTGNFSAVYRAKHKLDGHMYAVKKTKGSIKVCQSEAQVLAACSACMSPNIVRYYNSWVEDGRLHLQTELCECSLPQLLQHRDPPLFEEDELVELMQHVGRGLGAMHAQNMVHLDVKPDNILRSHDRLFKIADLGLATLAISSSCNEIAEGDCRYLARELLKQDFRDPSRADVFSFGIMSYELAVGRPLPTQGDEWHWLRDGVKMDDIPASGVADLIVDMMQPDAMSRPSCEEILKHARLLPQADRLLQSKVEQVEQYAEKNKVLNDQLIQVQKELFAKANPRTHLFRHFSC